MEKFQVTVWFADKTIIVSAKNKSEAKQKAYKKFEKKTAASMIDKKCTTVY